MMRRFRTFLCLCGLPLLWLPLAGASRACPGSTVRIVVPVAAGGPMDRLARHLADHLAKSSDTTHVVENRSGGMTIPAWDAVAKSAADGCTLLVASVSGRTALRWQVSKLPFDAARDFVAVTPLADVPQLFVGHPSTEIRTLAELVERARREPGGVSIAIPTPGALGACPSNQFWQDRRANSLGHSHVATSKMADFGITRTRS